MGIIDWQEEEGTGLLGEEKCLCADENKETAPGVRGEHDPEKGRSQADLGRRIWTQHSEVFTMKEPGIC